MWLINQLAPSKYDRFLDVFGGSATVTLNRPIKKGCLEVYNDFNSNLTNLFFCVKERPMALLEELGFLPLNCRDGFNVLYKFFNREEFTDEYMREELMLAEIYLRPPQREAIKRLMRKRSQLGDVRRAADYFKLVRYSFSGGAKAFAGKSCNIRSFFYLIWECSRRLADVLIENKDFDSLIQQYDRPNTIIYCDPPYYEAEDCYVVEFGKRDHQRLHDRLMKCTGYVILSYNDCDFVRELYQEFYILHTTRPNSMSQKANSEYDEAIITNYDPRPFMTPQFDLFVSAEYRDRKLELVHIPDRDLREENLRKLEENYEQ